MCRVRASSRSVWTLLAGATFFLLPQLASAQYYPPPGYPPYPPPGGGGVNPAFGSNTSSLQNTISSGGVNRMTNSLANPLNFIQYGQTTGIGPIRGTVRIYNVFGTYAQTGGGGNATTGGGNFLGSNTGAGGFGTQIPGSGATTGDDGPQGVLLHVNYAQMFFPNQQNLNQSNNAQTGFQSGGGLGGYPGFGYGYGNPVGKGGFGNGGSGL